MTVSSVLVSNLVVGDRFSDGSEVTMLGLATDRDRFVAVKTRGGRCVGTTFPSDKPVQIDTRFRA